MVYNIKLQKFVIFMTTRGGKGTIISSSIDRILLIFNAYTSKLVIVVVLNVK